MKTTLTKILQVMQMINDGEDLIIIDIREKVTDVTWNTLRLAKTLHKSGEEVNILLMNDAVDLARNKIPQTSTFTIIATFTFI